MASPVPPRPTDAELAILRVLWDHGPATVRQIHERLGGQGAYTTVLKFMQIMTEKGLVRRELDERTHIYAPTQPAHKTQRQLVKDLLERAFAGSARNLLLQALAAKPATPAELAELQELLKNYSGGEDSVP